MATSIDDSAADEIQKSHLAKGEWYTTVAMFLYVKWLFDGTRVGLLNGYIIVYYIAKREEQKGCACAEIESEIMRNFAIPGRGKNRKAVRYVQR